MPTMKDVAKRAGVSLGTVSNVLNNRASVLPENRERVLEAVESLGFRTNMVARTLKTKYSNDIGLIIPDISNPFYPELARGAEDAANKAGFQVFLCNNDRMADKEQSYIESLLTKNIDGLIIVKPQTGLEDLGRISKRLETVLVDVGIPLNKGYNVLNVNDHGGILQGMEYLYKNGHKRIGFISGLMESFSSQNRCTAYRNFLKDKRLPVTEAYILKGDYSYGSGYECAKKFMELGEPPTAIFAANDLMALGCVKALHDLGLEIPRHVSVMGYDNIAMTTLCHPMLTTIDQPKYNMGARSVEILVEHLAARHASGKEREAAIPEAGAHEVLETELVVRQSVAEANPEGILERLRAT